MHITMNDEKIVSVFQLEAFLKAVDGSVDFSPETKGNKNKQKIYDWIGNALSRLRYFALAKRERGIVLSYLKGITRLSRPQLKRLIARKRKVGKILVVNANRHRFPIRYGAEDIARLVETDNLHLRLSGKATKAILKREFEEYGKYEYENVRRLSVSHMYRLRGTRRYASHALTLEKTRSVSVPIGVRRKPKTDGKPGFLRVDSVHQGDIGKLKGIYHINLVDEVTQWEIVLCVEGISEEFLHPALEEALAQFPFRILGFHSDNGSEYINAAVARLLNKLVIEQTKSRSRRTNDNALVESKNGSVVRKHFGYVHIPKKFAKVICEFQRMWFNPYVNFHRPSGFATEKVDERGKITKKYDAYLTPYAKLVSLASWEKYLKPGVSPASLREIAHAHSDNEFASLMQKEKSKLFKSLA